MHLPTLGTRKTLLPAFLLMTTLLGTALQAAESILWVINATGSEKNLHVRVGDYQIGGENGTFPGSVDGPYTVESKTHVVAVLEQGKVRLSTRITVGNQETVYLVLHGDSLPGAPGVIASSEPEDGPVQADGQKTASIPDPSPPPARSRLKLTTIPGKEFAAKAGEPVLFILSYLDPVQNPFGIGGDQGPWPLGKPVRVKNWSRATMTIKSKKGWEASLEWSRDRIEDLRQQVMIVFRGRSGLPEVSRLVLARGQDDGVADNPARSGTIEGRPKKD